jgi:hypothetical protein
VELLRKLNQFPFSSTFSEFAALKKLEVLEKARREWRMEDRRWRMAGADLFSREAKPSVVLRDAGARGGAIQNSECGIVRLEA